MWDFLLKRLLDLSGTQSLALYAAPGPQPLAPDPHVMPTWIAIMQNESRLTDFSSLQSWKIQKF